MSKDLIYHHNLLLNDKVRMAAYAAAIKAAVKPGDVVLDLGAGLGILSFLAVKAGAKRVYAMEYDAATIKLAKTRARENDMEQKIIFLKGLSGKLTLPEKVDVIVTETFSNVAVNENILPNILDARKRFLKKGGIIIPKSFNIYAVPVAFSVANGAMQVRSEKILPKHFLSTPQKIAAIDLYKNNAVQLQTEQDFKITQAGKFNGFAMWFDTVLHQKISFSTAPDKPATHWQQAFLPASELLPLKPKQKMRFYFESVPDSIPAGPLNHLAYGYEFP